MLPITPAVDVIETLTARIRTIKWTRSITFRHDFDPALPQLGAFKLHR